jgi:hypothetical protein
LHEARLKAPYGFVLYDWFNEVFRVAANVLIPAGAHSVVSRILDWRWPNAKWWGFAGDFIVLVAQVMAFYYLGSLLADQVLWLQIAEVSTAETVSRRKNQFDATFSILLWILALFVLVEAAVALWREEKDLKEIPWVRSWFSKHRSKNF